MRRGYDLSGIDRRSRVANVVLLLAFFFLLFIFVRFQLVQSVELSLKSDENRLRVFPLMPPRGVIVDRRGEILADNRPFYSVSLLPGPRDLIERELSIIAMVFPGERMDVDKILERRRGSSVHPVRVLERVSMEALAVLEEHREMLPGLKIQAEPLRYYPYGNVCSHVIGYVGRATQAEVKGSEWEGIKVDDYIGRAGVESGFDDNLRGKWGAAYIEIDAMGREVGPYEGKEIDKPVPGEALTLTIDTDLQLIAAEAFPDDGKGAVICLNPKNGEILALYSSPTFDPNDLSRGIKPDAWEAISSDPKSPLLNRVIQAAYPPGSTFKPVTALIAMEKGLFSPTAPECVCYGGMHFGRRRFSCWKEMGHGHIDFIQGLAQSCDVYFYKLGIRVGLEDLTHGALGLGLGAKTGVDLPNEVAGLIPTLDWYNRTFGPSNWGRGVIMNLSIGQGEILITPLQLARLYATICNGGKLVVPHIVKTGDDLTSGRITLPDENNLQLLLTALTEAVNGDHGTGDLAAVRSRDITVAGKTGTSENPHGEDHALFVGYAPADNPEILCAVIVEESGHGGSVAAPIVGEILEYYFTNKVPSSFTGNSNAAEIQNTQLDG